MVSAKAATAWSFWTSRCDCGEMPAAEDWSRPEDERRERYERSDSSTAAKDSCLDGDRSCRPGLKESGQNYDSTEDGNVEIGSHMKEFQQYCSAYKVLFAHSDDFRRIASAAFP